MNGNARRNVRVFAPVCGWCDSLDDSPDPVFRDRVLGDGVSIDPTAGSVLAPFDGEILAVPESGHAISLRAGNGAELLIHIGIDTVTLRGEGFRAHVRQGDRVARGQRLLTFAVDQVLRRVPSLRSPVLLLRSDAFELRGLRPPGPVEPADMLFEIVDRANRDDPEGPAAAVQETELTRDLVVGLEHGVHARPAASIIAAIRSLDARVLCRTADGRSADARSAVSMMALGIQHGQAVTVAARGADAARALSAIAPLLRPLDTGAGARIEADIPRAAAAKPAAGSVLRAQPASFGLATGQAVQIGAWRPAAASPALAPDQERSRLQDALRTVAEFLQTLGRAGTGSEIADAHLALLGDPAIAGKADEHIGRGDRAEVAWHRAIDEFAGALSRLEDRRMRERVDDLVDIDQRVQRVLAGRPPDTRPELPAEAVLIAGNLLPSQLLELEPGSVAGICTAAGGTTSHAAILAASLGIPMLVAAGDGILAIDDGTLLGVDADFGELLIQPEPAAIAALQARARAEDSRRQDRMRRAGEPCVLSDGTRVHVMANIASVTEAEAAVRNGADGCGLLRTEFLFMDRPAPPDVQEQLHAYRRISEALGERPLTVRLLDAGGDKPLRYVTRSDEENPALGVRGVRLTLRNRALLETQLEALHRLSDVVSLQVMIPMVTSVDEVGEVRGIIESLRSSGEPRNALRLGIMIETPAAALLADRFACCADFFSIGTNDLTQYALAMDRGDPALAGQLDALHPAVLRLVAQTAAAANAAGKPVAVCGAAAGDVLAAPIFLGLGIHDLSMVAALIPRQKAQLRGLEPDSCGRLARDALQMSSAAEVRTMMREFLSSGRVR